MSTSRINPDSRAVLVVATVATAALALVSFLLSFNGLADAASWANVPSWLAWAIPAYVDGAILVYTLAALVFRARGESARLEWTALGVFAALSVAANGVHAWTAAPAMLQVTLGVLLAALAPVSVVITTHTIARLVVAPVAAPEEDLSELMAYAQADLVATAALYADDEVIPGETEPVVSLSGETVREGTPEPVEWLDEPVEVPRPEPIPEPEPEPVTAPTPIRSDESTEDRNARIRALDDGTRSIRAIAAEAGVSKSTVSRVLGRRDIA